MNQWSAIFLFDVATRRAASTTGGEPPLVLEDIETDCTGLTAHVWMPNFGGEFHLWRVVRIILGEDNVDLTANGDEGLVHRKSQTSKTPPS